MNEITNRIYRNNLDFIESAIKSCWLNAADLVDSSKLLLDNGKNALALSVSVLALEELGKLFCVDGLLFSRRDGHKADSFSKSMKSHQHKLFVLEMLPMFLGQLARLDCRYESDGKFIKAMAISLGDLKQRGNAVMDLLGDNGFCGLDKWKQSGFYSQQRDSKFMNPQKAVPHNIADVVHGLAWRAVSTLDYLLKDGGLERYIKYAQDIRLKLSENEHKKLEDEGAELFSWLFCEANQNLN